MRKKTGVGSLITITVIAVLALAYTLTWGNHAPQLGLDLKGGTAVVLAAKKVQGQPDPSSDALDQTISIIRRRVDGLGVAEPEITRQGSDIVVSLPGVKEQDQALRTVGRTARLEFRPACTVTFNGQTLTELPPGLSDDVYQAAIKGDPSTGTAPLGGACVQGTSSTSSTVPASGDTGTSSGASASTDASVPASSSAPASSAPASSQQSLGLLPAEGHRGVAQTPSTDTTPTTATPATTAGGATTTTAAGGTTTTGPTTTQDPKKPCGDTGVAAGDAAMTDPIIATEDSNHDGTVDGCAVLGPAQLDGTAVTSAQASIPQGEWVVILNFSDDGLSKFNTLSQQCFSNTPTCSAGTTAIVLDGNVESNPKPQTATFSGNQIQISGPSTKPLTQTEASDLALVLNYGSLPVQLEPIQEQTVSPTLGSSSLRAGLLAGAIGVAIVAIYMILYYRALGIVVVLGLMVWSALNFAIITYLSGTAGLALTLAGVTGIVVSVGVTTDSYIVYFERMKDEVKNGRSVRAAVDHAFKRAWNTIVTADLASFIGALLLYWLTVGAVRGFAFFLGLSTLLDLVTAYFFKRPMVALLSRSRFFTEARWIGIGAALGAEPRPAPSSVAAAPVGAGR